MNLSIKRKSSAVKIGYLLRILHFIIHRLLKKWKAYRISLGRNQMKVKLFKKWSFNIKRLNNFNLDQKLLSKNASKLSLVTYKSKKLIVSVFKFLCIETCQELFSKTGKMCAVSLNNIVQSKTISKWNSNVLSKNLESSMTSFRCLWVIWKINYALAEISVSLKE